jgi:uncharacterized protein YndB with AHSA1/START domain
LSERPARRAPPQSAYRTILDDFAAPVRRVYRQLVPRTDTVSRVIAASVERAYAALIDPVALATWIPPAGMSARIERFDLRPGGSYRMVLTYADPGPGGGKSSADSDIVEARFIDIVPGVRVVYEVDFVTEDPAYASTMIMTWAVSAVGEQCRVDITATNVPDAISIEDHAAGLASSLASLAAYLSG